MKFRQTICMLLVFVISCSLNVDIFADSYMPYEYNVSEFQSVNYVNATIQGNILELKIKDITGNELYYVCVGNNKNDLIPCKKNKDGYLYTSVNLNNYNKEEQSVVIYSGNRSDASLFTYFQKCIYIDYQNEWVFKKNNFFLKNKEISENKPYDSKVIYPVSEEIKRVSNEIVSDAVTEEEKVIRLYTWIVENVAYDRDSVVKGWDSYMVPEDIINSKIAVCHGMSLLLQSLCYAQNIPCLVYTGMLYDIDGAESHAWNEIYINNEWLVFDTTSDTRYSIENGERVEKKYSENDQDFLGGNLNSMSYYLEYEKLDVIDEYMLNTFRESKYSDWAISSLSGAALSQLYRGTLNGDMTRPITRGEFCDLLYTYLSMQLQEGRTFNLSSDGLARVLWQGMNSFTHPFVSENNLITSGIGCCYINDIVYGKSEDYFGVNDNITREEAATMLVRAVEFLDKQGGNFNRGYNTSYRFVDDDIVSDWAKDSISIAQEMGIMNGVGDNRFDPKGQYTVEQSISTIYRLYKYNFNR